MTLSDDDDSSQGSRSATTWTYYKYVVVSILSLTAVASLSREKALVDETISPIAAHFNVSKELPTKPLFKRIKQLSILGERNSGTRWTYAHLMDCFNHSLSIKRRLTRHKHWFQHNDTTEYLHDTLVIAQFRNPYEWVEAMRQVPHHSPAHMGLNWKEFCTKEWTTQRAGADLNITDFENQRCQQRFHYKDIISCFREPFADDEGEESSYYRTFGRHRLRFSENQPFYEMRNDGSGAPYKNIMELRADKIRNFLHVKEFYGVRDVWITKYEKLLADGTKALLDRITKLSGVDYQCDPYTSQNRRRRELSTEFINYLDDHVDWEAESLVGFSKFSEGDDSGLNVARSE